MPGRLTLVGTPIGNLGDFSPRARRALEEADFIAAEDTRVTLRLLNYFGIKKPLVSYFEHNKYQSGDKILARVLSGENCALVTDGDARRVRPRGGARGALRARGDRGHGCAGAERGGNGRRPLRAARGAVHL